MEAETIDWDSFKFKFEALNDLKVNMTDLLFDILVSSDLHELIVFMALNILVKKMEGRVVNEVIYGYTRGLDKRISYCKLAMHSNFLIRFVRMA